MGTIHWNPDDTMLAFGLLWSVTGFAAYYFLSTNERAVARFHAILPQSDPQLFGVLLQRIWGLLFLGVIPICIISLGFGEDLSAYGLEVRFHQKPPLWSYALIPLILIAGYLNASSPANLALYPQIRAGTWTRRILWLNALSWTAFLLAYEFLFRGLLLFSSLAVMDPWLAMSLNVSLYAFAHFYKGPFEVFGAIPFGFLLCYITIVTGNIWSALVIHLVMALSNEWFSLRAHPQMKVVKK
jgi:membrane protease YdiL (CAAX protease family)